MDDVVDEILLRLPPGDPACLTRASLVCQRWRRLLSSPALRRRYRLFHGTPPLLGFIHVLRGYSPYASRFVSISDLRPATRDLPGWLVLDCRHSRALFANSSPSVGIHGAVDLVVWNPTTNEQRHLPMPSVSCGGAIYINRFNAAVLCATSGEGCDHSDCHGGPFRVVFIFTSTTMYMETVTSACVYSSESGAWGDLTSVRQSDCYVIPMPSVLVGDALYFSCWHEYIFEYRLGESRLSVIVPPEPYYGTCAAIIKAEAGVLEFTKSSGSSVDVWSRELDAKGVARWIERRPIDLETILPNGALLTGVHPCFSAYVSGFVEGTDVIFMGTSDTVYMVQLRSRRVTKMALSLGKLFLYTDFYIPAMKGASTGEGPRSSASSTGCFGKVF